MNPTFLDPSIFTICHIFGNVLHCLDPRFRPRKLIRRCTAHHLRACCSPSDADVRRPIDDAERGGDRKMPDGNRSIPYPAAGSDSLR